MYIFGFFRLNAGNEHELKIYHRSTVRSLMQMDKRCRQEIPSSVDKPNINIARYL